MHTHTVAEWVWLAHRTLQTALRLDPFLFRAHQDLAVLLLSYPHWVPPPPQSNKSPHGTTSTIAAPLPPPAHSPYLPPVVFHAYRAALLEVLYYVCVCVCVCVCERERERERERVCMCTKIHTHTHTQTSQINAAIYTHKRARTQTRTHSHTQHSHTQHSHTQVPYATPLQIQSTSALTFNVYLTCT